MDWTGGGGRTNPVVQRIGLETTTKVVQNLLRGRHSFGPISRTAGSSEAVEDSILADRGPSGRKALIPSRYSGL